MPILAAIALLLSACKNEMYDTGDGEYSYMRADMCDISAHEGLVTSIITDDDVSLPFATGLSLSNAPSDTIIRRMLYYSLEPSSEAITILSAADVEFVSAQDTLSFTAANTVSRWESKNKKYINFYISEKQGPDSLYTEKKYYSFVK